jgi:hypothetical protein
MSTKITQREVTNAMAHLQLSALKLKANPDSETFAALVASNAEYLESMVTAFIRQTRG